MQYLNKEGWSSTLKSFLLVNGVVMVLTLGLSFEAEARQQSRKAHVQEEQTTIAQTDAKVTIEEFKYKLSSNDEVNNDGYITQDFRGLNEDELNNRSFRSIESRNSKFILPSLVGGLQTLYDNIEYPDAARINGIQGRVVIQFYVNELGMVEDAEVTKGIGGGCDEAVLQALESMRFSPGIVEGRFAKVKMVQSIVFELRSLR